MRNIMSKNVLKVLLLLVISVLVIAGCGSNQAKQDEADAEQIASIEEKVNDLFNEDKTDIVENISESQLEDISVLIVEIEEQELNEENASKLDLVVTDYKKAVEMVEFEKRVAELINEDGEVNEAEVELLKDNLDSFKDQTVFYDRQLAKIENAEKELEKQLAEKEAVEKAEEELEKLLDEDGNVKEDVTEEQKKKVEQLVGKVQDEKVKEKLNTQIVKVDKQVKTNQEKAKSNENKQVAQTNNSNNKSTGTSSNIKSNNQNTTKQPASSSSNTQTSKPKEETKPTTPSKPKQETKPAPSKPIEESKPKPQPKPEKPKEQPKKEVILSGKIGNSGMEFDNVGDAVDWANNQECYINFQCGWRTEPIFYGYKDANGKVIEGTRTTYTVVFF